MIRRQSGCELPEGLEIKFLDDPLRGRPVPDYEFFPIRLFNCRKYWVKKRREPGYQEVEICRGFEIVPNPIPGGPIGLGPSAGFCGRWAGYRKL